LSQFKKYHPSRNLKFHNLGIFQSLELRILQEKILPISLRLNFTPNTLGCYRIKNNRRILGIQNYNEMNVEKFRGRESSIAVV